MGSSFLVSKILLDLRSNKARQIKEITKNNPIHKAKQKRGAVPKRGKEHASCSLASDWPRFKPIIKHCDDDELDALYLTLFSAGAIICDTVPKSNQINSHRIIGWFLRRGGGKPVYPEKNLSKQIREPTNWTHMGRQVSRWNPDGTDGR